MQKLMIKLLLKVRWLYFHVNPFYKKFYMSADEAHFWNSRTNTIHSNFSIKG